MNFSEVLTATARAHPAVPAFADRGSEGTYAAVDRRVSALAAGLRAAGVGVSDRVLLLTEDSPEMVEAFFAVWRAGAAVVPINARYTADEVAYFIADSGAVAAIVSPGLSASMEQATRENDSCVVLTLGADGPHATETLIRDHGGASAEAPATSRDDLAWLMYTSGTTGRSKGAMLTHGNIGFIVLGMLADMVPIQPGDVALHAAPLTHGGGFLALAYVSRGARHVFLEKFDADAFVTAVEAQRVAYTWLVPTQIRMVLDSPLLEAADTSSLRRIVYGGAPIAPKDLAEAIRRLGSVFVQLWAQSESAMTGTFLPPEDHSADPEDPRLRSCGRVRTAVQVAVMDEGGHECDVDVPGEMCIRGDSVMAGYWRRPDETAQALRDGWLYTGDIGLRDANGYFFLLDRARDVIISGGLNVYPAEVEAALAMHPAVREVCVVGVPDDHWGEAVKAVIVVNPGAALSPADLLDTTASRLARFKLPKSIDFVDYLPKSAYGKILRRDVRNRYWSDQERKIN